MKYGGDTTCIQVQSSTGESLIIDAGSGIRSCGNELISKNQTSINMFFTHAHWDHILGFPFFKPLYKQNYCINIYDGFKVAGGVIEIIQAVYRKPYFPIDYKAVKAKLNIIPLEEHVIIGSLKVSSLNLSHPDGGYGYILEEAGKKFVFLTDNELGMLAENKLSYADYVEKCYGADLLIHDAEYRDEEYLLHKGWGHSALGDTVKLATDAQVKKLGLFHHNQDRTDKEVDSMVIEANNLIDTKYSSKVECFAVPKGLQLSL